MPGWLLDLLEFLATNLFLFAKPAKSLEQLFLFSGHQESVFGSLQKAEAKNKKRSRFVSFSGFSHNCVSAFRDKLECHIGKVSFCRGLNFDCDWRNIRENILFFQVNRI